MSASTPRSASAESKAAIISQTSFLAPDFHCNAISRDVLLYSSFMSNALAQFCLVREQVTNFGFIQC
jgi:hypothetical protein